MPSKAGSSHGSAARAARRRSGPAAAAAAAGAPGAAAAEQPPAAPGPSTQPEGFGAAKLQWALAVPPEQRQPSVQDFIDSCQCTTAATRLLAAAPLAQLSGPTKLRALLLLLKAHWAYGERPPPVDGLCLKSSPSGHVPEQAERNLVDLIAAKPEQRDSTHPELQPLLGVAAETAFSTVLATTAVSSSSSGGATSSSGASGALAAISAPSQLNAAAQAVDSAIERVRHHRGKLQQQLAGVGGGLLTPQQLEMQLLAMLGVVHMWGATPGGPYSGGRVDERHAEAGCTALCAALDLSDSEACRSGLLSALSNLLRRVGAVDQAEALLRGSVAAAQAAGDDFLELNAASALIAVLTSRDGWRYGDVASLLEASNRGLPGCKPWLIGPAWSNLRDRARLAEKALSQMRRTYPATYASQPLPMCSAPTPNTSPASRVAKKIGTCSGCGKHFHELKFCARCQAAMYCSRACQASSCP
ncbi:F-box protein [Chlorella sorokiniana]|uniref:F-box protein n=1 Tax=Chlorella sorokiniana TaxID=3076 RepID=A0A2P6TKY8_CHLSO|nr:F-box protein [Chlorella sorokiniana]|eukprot:PRW44916.1 F-box protein [Chlorella sorokiniana]